MSRVLYGPELPPAPQGMPAATLAILREHLTEDLIQTLCQYIVESGGGGSVSFGDRYIDVTAEPYNAVGDGVTDDTEAIQAALDAVSYVPGEDSGGTGGESATIYFPRGIYRITETLTLTGNNGLGYVIKGEGGLDRAGNGGSVLQWDGDTGGTLFDMIAVNGSIVQDIHFSGGDEAKYVCRAREHHYSTYSNQIASSGIQFFRCSFTQPGNVDDNACFAAGNSNVDGNTYQSSEYRFYQCFFQGNNELRTAGYGFLPLNGGNTKNFVFSHCVFNYFYRGITGLSGYLFVNECNGGIYGYETDENSCMIYSAANTCTVLGGGMENGLDTTSGGPHTIARFLISSQFSHVLMTGVYFAGVCPPDDYVVQCGGPLVIDNCHFERNSRSDDYTNEWEADTAYPKVGIYRRNGLNMYKLLTAGTSDSSGGPSGTSTSGIVDGTCEWGYRGLVQANWPKIQGGAAFRTQDGVPSNCHPTIAVRNSSFAYQVSDSFGPPIWDGTNWLGGGDYAKSTENTVVLEGNKYYEDSSSFYYQWGNIYGHRPKILSGCVWSDSNSAGITVLRDNAGLYVVRIPYTAFQTAALTRQLQWGQLPKKSKITQCVAEVTTAFAHPTGTITIKLGTNPSGGATDDDSLIVDSSTAAGVLGLADGDLGVGLVRASAVQGGFTPSWNLLYTNLLVTLTSSSGNLSGLTAGSVDIFLKFDPSK